MEDEPPKKQASPSYEKVDSPKKQPEVHIPSMESLEEPNREGLKFPIKNESINYSEFIASQVHQQPSHNPQAPPSNYMPTGSQNYQNLNMYPPNLMNMVPPSYFQGNPPA